MIVSLLCRVMHGSIYGPSLTVYAAVCDYPAALAQLEPVGGFVDAAHAFIPAASLEYLKRGRDNCV